MSSSVLMGNVSYLSLWNLFDMMIDFLSSRCLIACHSILTFFGRQHANGVGDRKSTAANADHRSENPQESYPDVADCDSRSGIRAESIKDDHCCFKSQPNDTIRVRRCWSTVKIRLDQPFHHDIFTDGFHAPSIHTHIHLPGIPELEWFLRMGMTMQQQQ